MNKRKSLPVLDYLVAFEAAARLGGFARAAESLHISESAISRKIRLLEESLSVALFIRGHRSVKLTAQGAQYFESVSKALNDLHKASELLTKADRPRTVRVAATHSVAALWLMPRLSRFHKNHPDIRIRLTASDNDTECLDAQMEMTILRGEGNWRGYDATLLFGETIFPVCAPGYLEMRKKTLTLANINSFDLIDVSSDHPEWMNWQGWLAHNGITNTTIEKATVFNTYPLAIQAAVDGLGIALGWGHLVDNHLKEGRLIKPFEGCEVRTKSGYYLLRKAGGERQKTGEIIAGWLLEESASRVRYAR